ncbi:MAG: hypothetical protein V4739_09415 [Pseudomonadota bacterium]
MQLITPELRDQVLEDPRRHEAASYPGLGNALLWLVVRKLLSEDELAAIEAGLRSAFSGEAYRERQDVLDEVKSKLRLAKQNRNRKALSTLLTEGLIDRAQFVAADGDLPDDDRCITPGAALAWAVVSHHVLRSDFDGLQGRQAELSPQARTILADAKEALKLIHKTMSAALWQRAFPGPRWAWVVGGVLFVAGSVWWAGPSTRTPDCDDKQVRATVSSLLFKASLTNRAYGFDRSISAGSLNLPENIKAVGYDSESRVRGCTCTVDRSGVAMPFAYTIEPLAAAGEFNVVSAHPAELARRFAPHQEGR